MNFTLILDIAKTLNDIVATDHRSEKVLTFVSDRDTNFAFFETIKRKMLWRGTSQSLVFQPDTLTTLHTGWDVSDHDGRIVEISTVLAGTQVVTAFSFGQQMFFVDQPLSPSESKQDKVRQAV